MHRNAIPLVFVTVILGLSVDCCVGSYSEDFESYSVGATVPGWTLFERYYDTVSSGVMTVEYDGELHDDTSNKIYDYTLGGRVAGEYALYTADTHDNFTYTVRLRAYSSQLYTALVFRHQDYRNEYRVWLRNNLRLRKTVDGSSTYLGDGTLTYNPGDELWLRVEAHGSNIVISSSIDGQSWQEQINVTDTAFSNGYVGFVPEGHCHFDDISIEPEEFQCGDPGTVYLPTDWTGLDGVPDCHVDILDLSLFVQSWLDCSDPGDPANCIVCQEPYDPGCEQFYVMTDEMYLRFSDYGLTLEDMMHGFVDYLDEPTPLFKITTATQTIYSNQLQVTERNMGAGTLSQTATYDSPQLEVHIELVLEGDAHRWRFSVTNDSASELSFALMAPELQNLRIAGDWDDDVVMVPFRSGVIKKAPQLSSAPVYCGSSEPHINWSPYLGGMSMQLLDISDEAGQEGMCLIIEDDSFLDKRFNVIPQDADGAVKLVVAYNDLILSPGESFTTPWNTFTFHQGGWEESCDLYRDWFTDTFGPIPDRPQWVREAIGSVRIHWLERAVDIVTAMPSFQHVIVRLNFLWATFDMSSSKEQLVRDTAFALKMRGVKTTGYIEGFCLAKASTLGQQSGASWSLRNADGSLTANPYGDTVYAMCAAATGWQDYLANQAVDMLIDLGIDGMYIDSTGFQRDRECYSQTHGHSQHRCWNQGNFDLLQKVSTRYRALKTNSVVRAEGLGADFLARYNDLGFDNQLSSVSLYKESPQTGMFQVCHRISNPLKYTFNQITCVCIIEGGDFAEVLLCNELCHINGLIPYENILTPTIEQLIDIRLDNLDTLNYGQLDKYLDVESTEPELMYNGFRGQQRYVVALLDPDSNSSTFTVTIPLKALPDYLTGKSLVVTDLWGSSVQWTQDADKITVTGSIGGHEWSSLRALMGTNPFEIREDRYQDLVAVYPAVEALAVQDNLRLIRISEAP